MATEDENVPSEPTSTACRHCGQSSVVDAQATPDWLCSACERYQQQVACPTCHQPTIISMLSPEAVQAVTAKVEV